MGKIVLGAEPSAPSAPGDGVALWPTAATPSVLKVIDDAGNVYTLALVEQAQTFINPQTFTKSLIVPGALNDEIFALDSSPSSVEIGAGVGLPVSASGAFSGMIILNDPFSGALAVYICGGGGVVKLGETGAGYFTANDGVTASRFDVSIVSSKYQIKNTFAATKILLVMAFRLRAYY